MLEGGKENLLGNWALSKNLGPIDSGGHFDTFKEEERQNTLIWGVNTKLDKYEIDVREEWGNANTKAFLTNEISIRQIQDSGQQFEMNIRQVMISEQIYKT